MIFEVDGKRVNGEVTLARLGKTLRSLKSYGPKSFACLTLADGSYMQVAGGRVTCILERREAGASMMFRAYLEEPRAPFSGPQTFSFGGGTLTVEPDEFLFIEDDVIPAFEAFFNGDALPARLKWRAILQTGG